MEYLGGRNLFTSEFVFGSWDVVKEATDSNNETIYHLHQWIDYKDENEFMSKYSTDNTKLICFFEFIDLTTLKAIIIDLYNIYKKEYPFSVWEDFYEYTFTTSVFELQKIIEREYRAFAHVPKNSTYNYYTYYLSPDREYLDYLIPDEKSFNYFKQFYKRVIELIDEVKEELDDSSAIKNEKVDFNENNSSFSIPKLVYKNRNKKLDSFLLKKSSFSSGNRLLPVSLTMKEKTVAYAPEVFMCRLSNEFKGDLPEVFKNNYEKGFREGYEAFEDEIKTNESSLFSIKEEDYVTKIIDFLDKRLIQTGFSVLGFPKKGYSATTFENDGISLGKEFKAIELICNNRTLFDKVYDSKHLNTEGNLGGAIKSYLDKLIWM